MTARRFGVVGVTSAAVGLAAGHLVAALGDGAASPVIAVGNVVVDQVPPWLKDRAIATFGTADKAVLVCAVLAGVLAVAAGLGMLAAKRPLVAVVGVVSLASLALVPAVWEVGFVWGAPPSVMTAVVGVATLLLQRRWLLGPVAADPVSPVDAVSRRSFLTTSAALGVGSVGVAALGNRVASPAAPLVDVPVVSDPLPPLPAGLDATVPGIAPLRTPVDDFYRIDINLAVPRVDVRDWDLRIDGLVETPFTLTFADLLALPMVEHDLTLSCVSNDIGGDLVGSARFQGVLVADLLRRARPRAGADMVLSSARDGFSASTPLEVLLDGRTAMIAVAMNGEPLTPAHGFPARLVTPGLYGFVGATKWIRRLKITRFTDDVAYWTTRGWSEFGPVKTASRIDTPRFGDTLQAGRVRVGGVAWATHRGIAGVEVAVDEGEFRPAVLGPNVGVDYWRQWRFDWDATPGEHTVTVRAITQDGEVQTGLTGQIAPDGVTGWHTVEVRVW